MPHREHREYTSSSSNVVRTLNSPHSRGLTNDHNLDNLLDDLQTSMDRSHSRDHQYMPPSNQTTVVRERSVSPGGTKTNRVYKTAQYDYSTTSRSSSKPQPQHHLRFSDDAVEPDVQQKINSLDSLLLDLKHERDHSLDRDKIYSNVGIDDGLIEPNYAKTTNTYRQGGKTTTVNRELNFDSPQQPTVVTTKTSTLRQSRTRQRSPTNVESHVTREVSYDSDPTIDNNKTSTINRSYNYSSTKKHSSTERAAPQPHQVVPYNEYVDEIDTTALPGELNGLPLDGGLLPGPGTKVTTTIKTYTYEIPGNAPVPTNQTFAYKSDSYNANTTNTTLYPAERDIPPTITHPTGPNQTTYYKNETYNTVNRTDKLYPNEPPRRSVSPIHPAEPTVNKSVIYSRETRDSTSNVYPSGVHPSDTAPPFPVYGQPSGPNQSTYIYKHETNTNTNVHRPAPVVNANPPYDPNTNGYPPHQPGPGPKQTYMYKREVTNTKNTVYGPPGGGQPQPIIEYPNDTYPPRNVTYNYTQNTTTRNVHHPDDRQPLIPLAPFPVDGHPSPNQVDGNPPKHLGELMDTFGGSNGYGDSSYNTTQRKEINTALATGKAEPIVEPRATMKPISGPPVYYPAGKGGKITQSEESAAWRAGGGYANARGKYEYESESKSKSSSKSGGAMVPVCLPLCCAMPCSIM